VKEKEEMRLASVDLEGEKLAASEAKLEELNNQLGYKDMVIQGLEVKLELEKDKSTSLEKKVQQLLNDLNNMAIQQQMLTSANGKCDLRCIYYAVLS
jgi:cobalamin biosynthesis Co2+ chelatase CbiK